LYQLTGLFVQPCFSVRPLVRIVRVGLVATGLVLCTATALATPAPAPAAPPAPATVALTFDDLPGIVLRPDQDYVDATNRALIKGLKRHHFPAIGFVNEGKLDEIVRSRQIAVLQHWLKAGFDLGNHTFSHASPNALGPVRYLADVARGEKVIRPMMQQAHRPLQWFRHPYLETGSPAEVKAQIDGWLASHGYRIAPVTIDADDWEFAEPYDDAVMRHDKAEAARIRSVYLAYTERSIVWYRRASMELFGRDIAYIMLLHDTRLNADCLESLAAMLARQNLRAVSLDAAMRDPAYQTADTYSGKDGVEWMERWSETLKKELPWDDYEEVPKGIERAYNRLDGK
jgi:peptidoglycan/xylan/chitin deacetylase (PgdA/CDA1 family)